MYRDPSIYPAVFMVFCIGLNLFVAGRIILIAVIFQGSWTAAMICLFVPFLEIGFIRAHFDEARWGARLWGSGLITMAAAGLLSLIYWRCFI